MLGTKDQLNPIATINPIKTGCNVPTPALSAITPVIVGKRDPPAWATTKISPRTLVSLQISCTFTESVKYGNKPSAEAWILRGSSLVATDMP